MTKAIEQRHVARCSRSRVDAAAWKEFEVLEDGKELFLPGRGILGLNSCERTSDPTPRVCDGLLARTVVRVPILRLPYVTGNIDRKRVQMSSATVTTFQIAECRCWTEGSGMHMSREKQAATREKSLVRFGLGLANWSERWFPDPLIFALLGIVVVFVIGLLLRQSPAKLAIQGGKNFWALVPFTMQMVMIIIGGYVVASTPVVYRAIRALADIPKTPRGAVALVALFSMLTSLISWGLSLIFSGLFVRELAHRVKGMDYRAAGAAAYLGLGAVWAMGLSSSAAMLMATKSAMPPSLFAISGLIPLTQTLFLWQSIATTAILIVLSVLIAYLSTPSPENARTAESYGIQYEPIRSSLETQEQARRVAGIQSAADHPDRRVVGLVSDRRIPYLAARRSGGTGPEYL